MRRSLALFLPVTMLVLELNASAHAAAPTDPQPLIENAPGRGWQAISTSASATGLHRWRTPPACWTC
ncbi:hypothetical protein RAA17_12930 [Komagataeibacter rhaeticus]|nr:hypothetical protein [Komagataeibacter rhaeticus]